MKDLAGRVLDNKYRLVRLIGQGGMGTVWSAEHTLINRNVAVKVMQADPKGARGHLDRFFREAEAASSIGHPNIIEIYDIGMEDDGTAYMVMEILKGESLEDVLVENGTLPPARVVAITLQILSALLAAHRKGIVHRDIKPDNVFIAVNARLQEEVKLLDFGVAKVLDSEGTDLKLTQDGTLLGTPYYFAPEQARGSQDLDGRTDLWAVGVMMYEMLSGELPYPGDNYNEVIGKVLEGNPIPLEEIAPEVPKSLVDIVSKAMQKSPDNRFPDAARMIKAMFPLQDDLGIYHTMKKSTAASHKAAKRTLKTIELNDDDIHRQSWISGIISKKSQSSEGPYKKGRMPVALGIAATIVISTIIGLALYLNTDSPKSDPVSVPVAQSPEVSRVEETPNTPPADEKPKEEPKAEEPPKPVTPSVEDNVTLKFVGLPNGAKVTVDGERVSTPHELPRSENRVEVRVNAPGFLPYSKIVTPDQDKTVKIRMKKRPGQTKSDDNSSEWKPNPFD